MNKWQMNRAGLLNYWYYDEEEFQFADGRLLLRGSNGSGKSVTMQSLITVLLDGVKTPDRLDSFGSRSRRMEDYLLGEKEIVNRDERTGYLYLEYKRQQTEQYITTGIGLHARRSGSIDFWGFVITDGRRIGFDSKLYKEEISPEDGSVQKIPLTRGELERLIGAGGQVVRAQQDYMELVNRHIFGFENVEQYQELMKLLIQLRSPKLSKDFKPSVIYEILNEALPSLSEEELRPLSDTIESMDRTKLQIAQLERDYQSIGRLCRQYDAYNAYVLAEKADLLQKAERRGNRLLQESKDLARQVENERAELAQSEERRRELERESVVLSREKTELEQHDVFRAELQKQEKEGELRQSQNQQQALAGRLADKQRRERYEREQMAQYEQHSDQCRQELADRLAELAALVEETGFAGQTEWEEQVKNADPALSFAVWRHQAGLHLTALEQVQRLLRQQREIRQRRDQTERDLGEERRLLDECRARLRKLEQAFDECRAGLLAAIYSWHQEHGADLPLDWEELRQMAQAVQGLYEGHRWQEVEGPLTVAYGRQVETLNREKGTVSVEIERLEAEEKRLLQELTDWRNQRDPEPERLPDHDATRRLLTEQNIPHIPFYAAVEFNAGVAPAVRERIEAALTEMGLLDALIIPERHSRQLPASEAYGMVIFPKPQIMTITLADYLHPTPPDKQITASDIGEVLRSILIEDGTLWAEPAHLAEEGLPALSLQSGVFRQGVVKGRAARRESAVYIGKQAREEYRRRQIALLEENLQTVADKLELQYGNLRTLRDRQERTQLARTLFPAETAIRTAFQDKEATIRESSRQEERVKLVDERLRDITAELQRLRGELQGTAKAISLPLEESAYDQAVSGMRSYQQHLYALELKWQELLHQQANAAQAGQRWRDLIDEVDELKGELFLVEEKTKQFQLEIAQMEARLQAMGADILRARVQQVTGWLVQLPKELDTAITVTARLQSEIRNHERQRQTIAVKLAFQEQLTGAWRQLLTQELRLGLVYAEELPDYQTILQTQGQWLKQDRLDRTALTDRLSKSFAVENNVLMEYRMQLEPVTTELDRLSLPAGEAEEQEAMEAELEKIREKASRQIITLDYEGRRQNPYYLRQALDRRMEEQKAILSDKDKELYEEVIMNSIGRIISRRIHGAQQWVEEMNKLMQQRDTSSGLRFKLEWKARTAEQDSEMDTADLVRLLHADPATLKEEDLQKIVHHFQSRIEQAKQASESAGSGMASTFQEAVRAMLDYRGWYQFKLYYEQSGLNWRELSDKVFFKFSGGEKAMAMYIPLFSAAYSRYQEASPAAPYVITLDEAFAGVDENNIRDTFALVEQLGFNYIMNSQALWGDYDVVPALAVCELIRPKNAPYVTVVRYYWNGQVRALLEQGAETGGRQHDA